MEITDQTGLIIMSTEASPRISLADREHVKVHRDADSNQLFISKPVLARVNRQWSIIATRRANNRDGSYAGVIGLAIDPSYFSNFYKDVSLGSQGVVALVGTDGVLRARLARDSAELGQNLGQSELMHRLAGAPSVSVVTRSAVDHVERIFASRRVRGYPLIVSVGTSVDQALASSVARAGAYRVATSVATLGVAAFALLLAWFNLRRSRAQQSIRQLKDLQATIIDTSMDAIITVDEDERILIFSSVAEKMFQVPAAEAIGQTLARFVPARFRAEQQSPTLACCARAAPARRGSGNSCD